MDRLQQLQAYSDAELLAEINRRRTEALERARALSLGSLDQPRYSRKSEAKARYWAEWREYKAKHPDATLQQWRRSQKRGAKK